MFTGMDACLTSLPDDPATIKSEVIALREKATLLEEHIRQLIHKRFGTSSEKCRLIKFTCSMRRETTCPMR